MTGNVTSKALKNCFQVRSLKKFKVPFNFGITR